MAAYRDPERLYRNPYNDPSRRYRDDPSYVEEMSRRRYQDHNNSVTSQSSSQVERGWVNDPRYKHKFVWFKFNFSSLRKLAFFRVLTTDLFKAICF